MGRIRMWCRTGLPEVSIDQNRVPGPRNPTTIARSSVQHSGYGCFRLRSWSVTLPAQTTSVPEQHLPIRSTQLSCMSKHVTSTTLHMHLQLTWCAGASSGALSWLCEASEAHSSAILIPSKRTFAPQYRPEPQNIPVSIWLLFLL